MQRIRILAGFALAAAMLVPAVVRADDHPYNKRYYDNRRYYDRDGRDYHIWNQGEDRAYRFYLNDQHRPYREWRAVKSRDQVEYFRWRHTHPDSVIFVVK